MNEAKRLLVLGEVSNVQETSSSEQQLQQDGSETQDILTTGSPVPTGLTTPPVESPEQSVTALQLDAGAPHHGQGKVDTVPALPQQLSAGCQVVCVCLSCLSVSLCVRLTLSSSSFHRWPRIF